MSNGLNALLRIEDYLVEFASEDYHYEDYVNDIMLIEKELKALDIIIRKHIDFHHFYKMSSYGLQEYNDSVWDNECLSKEEYDLLREVLL